jgi:multicomponent Na+:H+ antiporter subunit D
MLLSALLNASYWLPIVYISFFKKPPDGDTKREEALSSMLYPCIICALYIIALGTFAEIPGLPLSLAKTAAHLFLK